MGGQIGPSHSADVLRSLLGHHHSGLAEVYQSLRRFDEVSECLSQEPSPDRCPGGHATIPHSPLVGLFRAGYAEIEAQIAHAPPDQTNHIKSLSAVERALNRAARVESARLQRNLPFLATTAAATPFIGLFGTVWGIIGAFSAIGTTGSTSIVAVAPGISEALINTAAGLFAAIPALIFYNYFLQRLRSTRGEMEDYALEFLNLTERNFM